VPHDCCNVNGNKNQFEGRYRISQSHRAAVNAITFHIVNHNCSRSVEVFLQSWPLYWGLSGNYCSTFFSCKNIVYLVLIVAIQRPVFELVLSLFF